jgi:hypothetical protein
VRPSPFSSSSTRASLPFSKNSVRAGPLALGGVIVRRTSSPFSRSARISNTPSWSSSSSSSATRSSASNVYRASTLPSPLRSSSCVALRPSRNTIVVSRRPSRSVSASRRSSVSPSNVVITSGTSSPV